MPRSARRRNSPPANPSKSGAGWIASMAPPAIRGRPASPPRPSNSPAAHKFACLTSASVLVLFLYEHAAGHPEGRRRDTAAQPHAALPLLRRAPAAGRPDRRQVRGGVRKRGLRRQSASLRPHPGGGLGPLEHPPRRLSDFLAIKGGCSYCSAIICGVSRSVARSGLAAREYARRTHDAIGPG